VAIDCLSESETISDQSQVFIYPPAGEFSQQALAADSPVGGFFSKLRGRAAQAQSSVLRDQLCGRFGTSVLLSNN
jgi:hypothetical protein